MSRRIERKLDRIARLLEDQNQLLAAQVEADYVTIKHNERMLDALVSGGKPTALESFASQRVMGGEGVRRSRGLVGQ